MRTVQHLTPSLCALALCGALLASPASATISGVCPDGSIFIVQEQAQVPCEASKQVPPHEIPPLHPEYLPSPYPWQVWNERHDPNNPYNVIDSAQQVRGYEIPPGQGAPGLTPSLTPGIVQAAPTTVPLDLGFADDELRDLFTIVELSQQRVPARIARRTAAGRSVFELAMARSRSFERRLHDAWQSRGGIDRQPVLVFTAHSKRPEEFWANLTFVQGHLSYQPDSQNPRQLGVLQGRLGALEGGEVVLGYVVLPESWDLDQELDVYWNDRHVAATFGR